MYQSLLERELDFYEQTKQKQIDHLTLLNQELTNWYEMMRDSRGELESENENLTQLLQKLNKKLQDTVNTAKQQASDYETLIANLNSENETLAQQNKIQAEQLQQLQAKYQVLSEQLQTIKSS